MIENKCTKVKIFIPGNVTLAGSSKQSNLMGIYTFRFENVNGKPSYEMSTLPGKDRRLRQKMLGHIKQDDSFILKSKPKRSLEDNENEKKKSYLYWHSLTKKWIVGSVLGDASGTISWEDDVARPEHRSLPTTILVWNSTSEKMVADTIVINSDIDCKYYEGKKRNGAPCSCGTTDCTSSNMYCRKSSNKCDHEEAIPYDSLPDGDNCCSGDSCIAKCTSRSLGTVIQNYFGNDAKKRESIIKQYGLIENWDTSQVTNMANLFMKHKAEELATLNLVNWNLLSVTNMLNST